MKIDILFSFFIGFFYLKFHHQLIPVTSALVKILRGILQLFLIFNLQQTDAIVEQTQV